MFYSVPARYAGRRLPVRLAARTVESYDGAKLVARHERAVGRYIEVLTLDHYLEVLKTKLAGCPERARLAQAKASRAFTASQQACWEAARRARGDAAGTRALIEILLAHRTMPTAVLTAAMDRAVARAVYGLTSSPRAAHGAVICPYSGHRCAGKSGRQRDLTTSDEMAAS